MLRGSGSGSFVLARDRGLRVVLGRSSAEQSLTIFRSHRYTCTDAVGEPDRKRQPGQGCDNSFALAERVSHPLEQVHLFGMGCAAPGQAIAPPVEGAAARLART